MKFETVLLEPIFDTRLICLENIDVARFIQLRQGFLLCDKAFLLSDR